MEAAMAQSSWRCYAALLLFVAATGAGPTHAQAPIERSTPYRFVESRSALDERHVGTEQPDHRFSVFGTFTLEYRRASDDPWIGRAAAFVDVDAFFYNPLSAAPPQSLDGVLNLSGLTGKQLPIAAPFDAFEFTGKTKSGADVNLRANVLGSWLSLFGGTTLPAGQAVGVEYAIDAIARTRPFADFNDDGVVDGADLGRLTNSFGMGPVTGDATSSGDADGDGDVDGADFLAWQGRLGERPPASLPGAVGVPEPDASVLAILVVAALAASPRRRKAP
jgi:hypothetical protein